MAQAQTDGLLLHMPFDDGGGDTARDISGNNNDGDLGGTSCSDPGTGACPTWIDGAVEGALSFDGVDDYVYTSSFGLNSSDNTLTYEAWVYSAKNSNYQTLIADASQSPTVGFFYSYRYANSDYITWQYSSGSGFHGDIRSSNIFSLGNISILHQIPYNFSPMSL